MLLDVEQVFDYCRVMRLGELIHTTDGRWVVTAPTHCNRGHRLGPNRVIVGFSHCRCTSSGHHTWMCETCRYVVMAPPCLSKERAAGGETWHEAARRRAAGG